MAKPTTATAATDSPADVLLCGATPDDTIFGARRDAWDNRDMELTRTGTRDGAGLNGRVLRDPRTLPSRSCSWLGRHRRRRRGDQRALWSLRVPFLILVAGIVILVVSNRRARAERVTSMVNVEPPSRSRRRLPWSLSVAAALVAAVGVGARLLATFDSSEPARVPEGRVDVSPRDAEILDGATSGLAAGERSAHLASQYLEMRSGATIDGRTTLLAAAVELAEPEWIYVQTDGSYEPIGTGAAAAVHIEVDGSVVSNVAEIDWRGSTVPVAHSFNAIGAVELAEGAHTVSLVADAPAGSFAVSARSNLSVFVDPADSVKTASVTSASGPHDFTTSGRRGPDVEHRPVASVSVSGEESVVALAAGSLTQSGHSGDAMVGLYRDGSHSGNDRTLWSVQDLWEGAELTGPVATQALLASGPALVSLDVAEFPWESGEDPAVFGLRPSARLVTLTGGQDVLGHAKAAGTGDPERQDSTWDYACIGTSINWPTCPEIGSTYVHAEARIAVPRGHPGVVLLAAKTRVAGDEADEGGVIELWLTVDGIRRGSTGRQVLRSPSSVSTRTLTASYLAAGDLALAPGTHTVRVLARGTGSFRHVSVTRDIPLLWFG